MTRPGRPSRELTPLASAWHRLGAELRSRREDRRLSQAQLGDLVLCSGALVGKIELAHRRASFDTIERADTALEAAGVLEALWQAATREDTAKQTGSDRTNGDRTNSDEAEELVAVSLRWVDEVADAVGITCSMWRSEAAERTLLASAPWTPAAYAEPLRSSLAGMPDAISGRLGRMIGQVAVEGMWLMSESFTDADHRLGGGYARSTLIHYLDAVVRPILLHGGYTERVGRGLLTAAGRLCNLCAFMSFDSAEQGLAQRYFLQALRLVHASGNHALAGHILGDMSMQAQHLGEANWALELAEAGHKAALRGGSALTAARCAVMQGRAYSLRRDSAGAARSRLLAEQLLDRSAAGDEPSWIRFFTPEQLAVESQYIAADLGQHDEVKRLAPLITSVTTHPATAGGMQRRRVLSTAALASAYLPRPGDNASPNRHSGVDIDYACRLITQVLPALPSLTSMRAQSRVDHVRRSLAPYRDRASVLHLEELHHSLSAASTAGRS